MKKAISAQRQGFTLIELLIVVGVLMLTTGGVVTNYNSFNNSQKVKQATLTLKDNLRLAQTKAISGNKPTGCVGALNSYVVTFSGQTYTIAAKCGGSIVPSSTVTIAIPSGVTLATYPNTTSVEFAPVVGSVNVTGSIDIGFSAYNTQYGLELHEDGQIIEANVVIPTPTPTLGPTSTPIAQASTPTNTPLAQAPTATPTTAPFPTHAVIPTQSSGFTCANNCASKVAGGHYATKSQCQSSCSGGINPPPIF